MSLREVGLRLSAWPPTAMVVKPVVEDLSRGGMFHISEKIVGPMPLLTIAACAFEALIKLGAAVFGVLMYSGWAREDGLKVPTVRALSHI